MGASAPFTPSIPLSVPIPQQKRKLRIYISNTFTPAKEEGEGGERVASWELRVEGKLLEDVRMQQGWREELWSIRSIQEGGREELVCQDPGGMEWWWWWEELVHRDHPGGVRCWWEELWSIRAQGG